MGTLLSATLKLMNLGGLMIDEPDAIFILRLRDEQFPVVDNIVLVDREVSNDGIVLL